VASLHRDVTSLFNARGYLRQSKNDSGHGIQFAEVGFDFAGDPSK